MSILSELRNSCLLREIKSEINKDVFLLGVNGTSYFGSLQNVLRDRFAALTAATTAVSGLVEILTLSEIVQEPTYTLVDLYSIVGIGSNIASDPYVVEAVDEAFTEQSEDGISREESEEIVKSEAPSISERGEKISLVRLLLKQIGKQVSVTTLGGFLVEGMVIAVEDSLLTMSNTSILAPGMDGSIIETVGNVAVSLNVLTSVST
jgi:small nuclear ribonucleoprotein (snRNP)-like protein